ncbi:hypothetical protein BH24ACT26_BH24ACT26_18220 [soil metagenome]
MTDAGSVPGRELAVAPAAADWGAPDDDRRRRGALALAVTLGAASIAAAGVLGILLGPSLAIVAPVALLAGALWWWIRRQGLRALRSLRAAPIEPADEPRLANLAAGLARDAGVREPSLWVIPGGGPNALVCRAHGGCCVAVTRSLLESYTRTELEAVVAHCLVRATDTSLLLESLWVAGGRLSTGAVVSPAIDLRAVALTRYPPALAAAIRKAVPQPRFGAFWFVAEGSSQTTKERRLATLADL